MKKLISIILIVLFTGIIPVYAVTVTFEFTPNEIVTADISDSWYMDDTKKLHNDNGVVGYVAGKSYDEPLTDINKASLDFLKARLLNNIMLVETIGARIHLYEADTTSGTAFVFTSVNESLNYMFLMCVYQNKISYTAFKTLAQSVAINYIEGDVIAVDEIIEEVIETVADEVEAEEVIEPVPEEPKKNNSIGSVLSTDIVAFIDGMPVASYNVDGKTVVIVENLVDYGFKVTWEPDARKLIASVGVLPSAAPQYIDETSDLPIGTEVGEIYATDIVTEINGREYESYNMNGQTVVVLEALGDRMIDTDINIFNPYKYSSGGFKVLWDSDTRTINVHCIRPGDLIDTWAGSMKIKDTGVVMKPVEYTLLTYTIEKELVSDIEIGDYTMQTRTTESDYITAIKIGGFIYFDIQKYMELKNVTSVTEKNGTLKIDRTDMNSTDPFFGSQLPSDVREDMLLPLDLIVTNGKNTARSNNAIIAYYYKDGAIMVKLDVIKNIIG